MLGEFIWFVIYFLNWVFMRYYFFFLNCLIMIFLNCNLKFSFLCLRCLGWNGMIECLGNWLRWCKVFILLMWWNWKVIRYWCGLSWLWVVRVICDFVFIFCLFVMMDLEVVLCFGCCFWLLFICVLNGFCGVFIVLYDLY